MKLKINTKVIKALKPCENRFNNWLQYYEYRNFTLKQFLGLNKITHSDKLWVVLRLVDNDIKIIFALDCAFSAADAGAYAAAAYADAYAYAADDDDVAGAAATAAGAADTKKSYKAELVRQLRSLIYLIEGNGS